MDYKNQFLLKILVIEDDRLVADQLTEQLSEIGYEQVTLAHDSTSAFDIFVNQKPDFLILDIGLVDSPLDGIELCKQLHTTRPTPTIFLSGFSDQATLAKVKTVPHSNYLIKPCSTRQLFVSIDRAIDEFAKVQQGAAAISNCYFTLQENHFYIKGSNSAYERVEVADIKWIETVRGGIELHLSDAKTYMLTASLNSFILQFQHPSLVRVHRSFMINKDNVSAIKDRSFILNGNSPKKIIPCSQSYWNDIKNQFKTLRSD